MPKSITFRPHHFLCSLGYQGKGYDDAFTANMDAIVTEGLHQEDGDDTIITVTREADVICGSCPHRRSKGCASQEKIDGLDSRHAERLQLNDGDVLSWGGAKGKIKAYLRKGDLSELCEGCQWLELGLCEDALAKLIDGHNNN